MSILHSEIDETNPPVAPAWIRWAKWIVILVAFLWLAGIASSLVIQHTSLKARLTAHLSAAFGRPVEVGRYDLNFLGGPALEAHSVTVGEDPRFGNEFFLRSQSIAVRLDWHSLLRGHLNLGTLSLAGPSLNLVRNSEGDWNLAEWLPRPAAGTAAAAPAAPTPSLRALRFSRIEVDGGRIDFKLGDEKLPFSLIGVQGVVETESPGRWRLDLSASPFRGAAIVQQAGTLHLTGHVGGTSSRLRPAILQLSWTDASIPDVLRLLRNNDYGIRGFVSMAVEAHTEGYAWILDGNAQLREMHRWDMTARPDNPSLNVTARAEMNSEDSLLDFTTLSLDAPHSHADISGIVDWSGKGKPTGIAAAPNEFQLNSSGIELGDLLSWVRAFRPDVAGDIALRGFTRMQIALRGWPPWPAEGSVSLDGGELTGARLRVPVRVNAATATFSRNALRVTPLILSFGSADGSLRIEFASTAKARGPASANLSVSGSIAHVRDLISTAGAFGWNLSRGWDLEGPLRGDLRWLGAKLPWLAEPVGSLEWGGESGVASLRTPFLNQPVEEIRARADWKAGDRRISLASALAFGAHWSGTFDRGKDATEWKF
ncbi:MAG: AsmA family protein, partial [Candidatus Acidiferrales bacterium]